MSTAVARSPVSMSRPAPRGDTDLPNVNNDSPDPTQNFLAVYHQSGQSDQSVLSDPCPGWDVFLADYRRKVADGLFLVQVASFTDGGAVSFLGVYRPGGGSWEPSRFDNWDDFQADWDRRRWAQTLTDIEVYQDGETTYFVGVYQEGTSGGAALDYQPGIDAFQASWQRFCTAGKRLIGFGTGIVGGQRVFCGSYAYAGQNQVLPAPQPALDAFNRLRWDMADRQLLLARVRTYDDGAGRVYLGLFNQSDYHTLSFFCPRSGLADLVANQADMAKRRARLVQVEPYTGAWGPWGELIYQRLKGQAVGYSYAVFEHGVPVEHGGCGWAVAPWGYNVPGEPMTSSHRVTVGSVSKTITAVALLRLIQDGLPGLSLDAPFFPLIEHAPLLGDVSAMDPRVRTVTLRNLLTMTSGMSWHQRDRDWNDPVQLWAEVTDFLKTSLDDYKQPPGTYDEYLNINFGLLRAVISNVTGTWYPDYVRQAVLGPLGMTDTEINPGTRDPLYYSKGQRSGPGAVIPNEASWRSTALDMGRFLQALRPGGGVLDDTSRAAVLKPVWVPRPGQGRYNQLGLYPGTTPVNGVPYSQHNGGYTYSRSCLPEYGARSGIVRFDDDQQTDVVILVNTVLDDDVQPVAIIPEIYDYLSTYF